MAGKMPPKETSGMEDLAQGFGKGKGKQPAPAKKPAKKPMPPMRKGK